MPQMDNIVLTDGTADVTFSPDSRRDNVANFVYSPGGVYDHSSRLAYSVKRGTTVSTEKLTFRLPVLRIADGETVKAASLEMDVTVRIPTIATEAEVSKLLAQAADAIGTKMNAVLANQQAYF